MKYLYNILMVVALPLALLRLLWRSRHNPDYRKHWNQRLALAFADSEGAIWIHTVSVGEFRATLPLIEALLAAEENLLITTTTPTGAATAREALAGRAALQYLPFDAPFLVKRFLNATRPRLAVFVETEIWANYLQALKQRSTPALLINARLSARSLAGYQKLGAFGREAIGNFSEIACQNHESCQRFLSLGAKASVVGNIKFDLQKPADLPAQQAQLRAKIGSRPFIIAASTHKGEEAMLLEAYQHSAEQRLLVIAPRHPERTDEVATVAQKLGLTAARYTQTSALSDDTAVLIVDCLGQLLPMYSLADYAVIGGSFVAHGGHNPLEAALFATPCVIGEHHFNFEALINAMQAENAIEVITVDAVFKRAPSPDIGQQAQRFLADNQGATGRYFNLIQRLAS